MIKICEMFKMVGELNVELLFSKTSSKPKRYFLKVDIVKFRTNKREKKIGYCSDLFWNVLSQEDVEASLKRNEKNSCLEGLIN